MKCKLCSSDGADGPYRKEAHALIIHCPRCGTYLLTDRAVGCEATSDIAPKLYLLSGLAREYHERGGPPLMIKADMFSMVETFQREVVSRAPSSIRGKAKAILEYIAAHSDRPGQYLSTIPNNDYPLGFCKAEDEYRFYLSHLQERGLLIVRSDLVTMDGSIAVCVTAQGWDELSGELRRKKSDQCFVAMWFNPAVDDAFTLGIQPLEQKTGYRMIRIDMQQFNEKICDRIMAEIKGSHFMIADVTGHRHAVYFEAGVAMGLGIPVIWCCREDDIGNCPNFDTRQYNHILWNTPMDLQEKLAVRISATIMTKEEINKGA